MRGWLCCLVGQISHNVTQDKNVYVLPVLKAAHLQREWVHRRCCKSSSWGSHPVPQIAGSLCYQWEREPKHQKGLF